MVEGSELSVCTYLWQFGDEWQIAANLDSLFASFEQDSNKKLVPFKTMHIQAFVEFDQV